MGQELMKLNAHLDITLQMPMKQIIYLIIIILLQQVNLQQHKPNMQQQPHLVILEHAI